MQDFLLGTVSTEGGSTVVMYALALASLPNLTSAPSTLHFTPLSTFFDLFEFVSFLIDTCVVGQIGGNYRNCS